MEAEEDDVEEEDAALQTKLRYIQCTTAQYGHGICLFLLLLVWILGLIWLWCFWGGTWVYLVWIVDCVDVFLLVVWML